MSGHSHHSAAQESETWPGGGGRSSTKRVVRLVKVGDGKGLSGGKEDDGVGG